MRLRVTLFRHHVVKLRGCLDRAGTCRNITATKLLLRLREQDCVRLAHVSLMGRQWRVDGAQRELALQLLRVSRLESAFGIKSRRRISGRILLADRHTWHALVF